MLEYVRKTKTTYDHMETDFTWKVKTVLNNGDILMTSEKYVNGMKRFGIPVRACHEKYDSAVEVMILKAGEPWEKTLNRYIG